MSDKRYMQLLIAACITTIIVAFIWKLPDAMTAQSKMQTKLGEYVYVDRLQIVHVSRKCPRLNYKGFRSRRIKVVDVKHLHGEISFCPNCVSDKDYEALNQ